MDIPTSSDPECKSTLSPTDRGYPWHQLNIVKKQCVASKYLSTIKCVCLFLSDIVMCSIVITWQLCVYICWEIWFILIFQLSNNIYISNNWWLIFLNHLILVIELNFLWDINICEGIPKLFKRPWSLSRNSQFIILVVACWAWGITWCSIDSSFSGITRAPNNDAWEHPGLHWMIVKGANTINTP